MFAAFLAGLIATFPWLSLNEIPSTVLRSLLKRTASTASYAETSPSPVTTISPFTLFRKTSGIEPATELPVIIHVSG